MTHAVNFEAGLLGRDPFVAVTFADASCSFLSGSRQSELAVKGQRGLQRDEGLFGSNPASKRFVEPTSFIFANVLDDFYGGDDALHTGGNYGFGAWTGASRAAARLERNVER